MAAVAKLNYTNTTPAAVNVSLLDDSGFYLAAGNEGIWIPKVPGIGLDGLPSDLVESMVLWVNGTSHDDVATIEQTLADMMRRAANYWVDPDRKIPVWLHSQLENETYERRALVYEITYQWLTQHYSGAMIDSKPRIKAGIARVGAWETVTESTYKETAAISTTGGQYDYTAAAAADVVGNIPARLNYLITWANSANMSVFWAGIRAGEKHDLTSYDPVFTFAADFIPNPAGDGSDVADATAKDGNRMEITFAGHPEWYNQAINGGGNIGAGTASGETGNHLILLRAKVDAGTVADVKLSMSYTSTTAGVTYTQPLRIEATSWTIYPLNGLLDNSDIPNLTLWARQVSGAGSLHIDCLVLIPVDSLFLFAEGEGTIGTSAGNNLQIFTRADGTVHGYSGLLSERVSDVQMVGPGIPVGDGRMVVCAARADRVSVITDTLTLKMNHWQRWASLRGAE